MRDELLAEQLAGDGLDLVGAALDHFDAAALAATAGVNLRLDDDDRDLARLVDQALGRLARLLGVEGDVVPFGTGMP